MGKLTRYTIFVLSIYFITAAFSPLVYCKPGDTTTPLNISMIWDPEDFDQWYAIQYIREITSRFNSSISVKLFYAVNNEEAQRHLLLLTAGQQVLFSYTQGRILIPGAEWEDSVMYAGILPEEIDFDIKINKGNELFNNQKIPEQLLQEYNKRKYPVIMISENIYPEVPELTGWSNSINNYLKEERKIVLLTQKQAEKIKLFIVWDEKHVSGRINENVVPMLKNFGIEVEIEKISSEEKIGKRYIKKLNIEKLPAYLFDKTIENINNFDKLIDIIE